MLRQQYYNRATEAKINLIYINKDKISKKLAHRFIKSSDEVKLLRKNTLPSHKIHPQNHTASTNQS